MASAAPPFIHSCTRPHSAPHNFVCRSVKISPNFCRCELSPQSLPRPIANNRGSYGGHLESNRCIPTIKHYITLIHGLCSKGKIDEAAKLLKVVCENGLYPNIVVFNRVISGFCKQGKMTEVVELLERMLECGHDPDMATFTSVINGFCNQGRIEDAFKLLEEMRAHGLSPDIVTYTAIVSGLCKAKELDKAIDLVEKMEREGIKPNAVTYNTLILGLCVVRKSEEAKKLLDEMAVKDCAPNIFTYNSVFRAMRTERREEAAIDLFNELTSKGLIPNDYTYSIIYLICKDGDLSAALKLIYCMLARDCIPDGRTYNLLLKRLFREGMYNQAMQLMREMEAKVSCPGSFNSARIGKVKDHRILKSDSQATSDSSALSGLVLFHLVLWLVRSELSGDVCLPSGSSKH